MKRQNILIIGSGGREHAIAWKVLQSPRVKKVFVAPGNGGTASSTKLENVDIQAMDFPALLEFAVSKKIDLTIIGPDDPLAAGIVDLFEANGLRVFGASKAASKLEWSKAFAKTMMRLCDVPTADFAVCTNLEDGLEVVRDFPFSTEGFVIKADGLALGKGVLICDTVQQAEYALEQMFSGAFGEAGQTVVIEQRLSGREVSALCFCDGTTARMMPPARDHKRALNGDNGLNTGGMGAYAPAPDISAALLEEIRVRVVQPILEAMAARGEPFKGVLYPGIMLTENGIRVLEFNARFGDPETQVLLLLLETDLLEIIDACIDGTLHNLELIWKNESCATVVMASGGYPLTYATGFEILGLESVPNDVVVFHAGTKLEQGKIVSSGGRVLSVSATGKNLEEALHKAYSGVKQIWFSEAHYRTDIGQTIVLNKPTGAYAGAGVNIAEGTRAVALMQDAVRSTHDARVIAGVGAFGGVFDISSLKSMQRPLLVASTDGVGTKTMVAAKIGDWTGIGTDIVNHGINDILVQGAKPLFFLDYIAANNLQAEWVATIVSSMAEACRAANCVILGGETAEMPGVYKTSESDVAGTMVGAVEYHKLIDGTRVEIGDCILALPSSGLHTNGYSLARKTLAGLSWTKPRAELDSQTIGEALLMPHRAYLEHINALQEAAIDIRAMAHITGGGLWDNIPRTLPKDKAAWIKRGTWRIPSIFKLILERAKLSEYDAYHAFNMGIGMTVVIPENQLIEALEILGDDVYLIGEIISRETESVVLQ